MWRKMTWAVVFSGFDSIPVGSPLLLFLSLLLPLLHVSKLLLGVELLLLRVLMRITIQIRRSWHDNHRTKKSRETYPPSGLHGGVLPLSSPRPHNTRCRLRLGLPAVESSRHRLLKCRHSLFLEVAVRSCDAFSVPAPRRCSSPYYSCSSVASTSLCALSPSSLDGPFVLCRPPRPAWRVRQ